MLKLRQRAKIDRLRRSNRNKVNDIISSLLLKEWNVDYDLFDLADTKGSTTHGSGKVMSSQSGIVAPADR